MILLDVPTPPEGVLTSGGKEKLTHLRQERHDAAREERDVLLRVRSRAAADYRCRCNFGELEEMLKGLSEREREGFSLLKRDEFERWGEIQERTHEAVSAQIKLYEAPRKRFRQREGWDDER